MTGLTEKQGSKIISLLEQLIKVNSGSKSLTTSSGSGTDQGKNSDVVSRLLDRELSTNQAILDIKNKIAKETEKINKIKSEDAELEKQSEQFLKKQRKFETLSNKNTTNMSRAQLKAHKDMLKNAEKEYKFAADKYNSTKKLSDLNKKLEKEKAEYLKNHQKEIDKLAKKEEKNALKKEKADIRQQKIANAIQSVNRTIFDFAKKTLFYAMEQDSAMSKLAANYAMSRNETLKIKNNLMNVAKTTSLIGVDASALAKSQAAYTDELGRSVILSKEGLQSIANVGVATGIGAEGAAKMAAEMELFGINAETMAKNVEDLMKKSRKNGMSSSVMTKKLQENLKLANNYTFKNGLRGVQDMTVLSSKLRINMSSIASLADKISSPEGAIQTAASLQVLGGAFAQMADPMKLLNQGITDMEGLTETYSKMLDGVGKIDKKTGELTINGYDRLRMKAAAEAMGISLDEMMTSARTKAKRNAIETSVNLNPSIKGNNDSMELLSSLAQYKEGKGFVVNIAGQEKMVANLNPEDINTLQPKNDSINLKTIAESTLGLKDAFDNSIRMLMTQISSELIPIISNLAGTLLNISNSINNFFNKGNSNVGQGFAKTLKGVKFGSKVASGAVAKGAGSVGAKAGLGAGAKLMGKFGGKAASKAIPGLGAGISALMAYNDFKEGDYVGGVLQTLSGIANLAGFIPGVGLIGTGISAGIDVLDAAREISGTKIGGYGPKNNFDKANDLLIPSNGRPIKLDKKDDVFAAKPGGALIEAISPNSDYKKTFGGVSKQYTGIYGGGNSKNNTINLNIQGSITLNSGSNSAKISASELLKDKNFVKEIARIIGNQMNKDLNGGKFSGGLINNSFNNI